MTGIKEETGELYTQKIIFKDTERHHADFKIKLEYDKINQTKFFRACLLAYLNDNPGIREIIENLQPKSKEVKKKIKKDIEEASNTKKQFALDEMEIENIFDIIEQEHPDL